MSNSERDRNINKSIIYQTIILFMKSLGKAVYQENRLLNYWEMKRDRGRDRKESTVIFKASNGYVKNTRMTYLPFALLCTLE